MAAATIGSVSFQAWHTMSCCVLMRAACCVLIKSNQINAAADMTSYYCHYEVTVLPQHGMFHVLDHTSITYII